MRISFPKAVVQLAIIIRQYMVQDVKEVQLHHQQAVADIIHFDRGLQVLQQAGQLFATTTFLSYAMRRTFSEKLIPEEKRPGFAAGPKSGRKLRKTLSALVSLNRNKIACCVQHFVPKWRSK
jgi:hypothetical protein